MKKMIIGIALILIGLFCLFGFIKIKRNDNKVYDYLNSAEYNPKNTINPENEGKLIIISGTYEVEENTSDKDFNVQITSPLIIRYVEYYKEVDNKLKWEVQYSTDDTYKYKKEIFYGKVKLGDYILTGEVLEKLSTNTPYSDITKEEAELLGFKLEEHKKDVTYLTEAVNVKNEDNNPKYKDSMRIYYEYYDQTKMGVKTIIGIQKDNNIVSTDDFTIRVYDGVKNKNEILKDLYKPNSKGTLFTVGSFFLFEIFGIILIINRKKDSI